MTNQFPAALALLVLAGCADIEAARRAQDPASAKPGERTVTAKEVGLDGNATLALDRGVEIALACNPLVAASRARADAAVERATIVRAGYYPQVNLSANYRGSKSSGGKDDDVFNLTHSAGAGINISQLVYDFGKTDASVRQADEALLASLADLRNTEDDLALTVRRTFYNILKQQALVAVAEETVRQFEKRLEQVEGFVQVGTRVKYDLTKAQVDLGNARLALVRARTQVVVDFSLLNAALGLAEETTLGLAEPAPAEDPGDFAALFGQARQQHPALAASLIRERIASIQVDGAIADVMPGLSLSGGFSVSGTLSPISWTSFLGPAINWLAYGGGIRDARIREAVAGLREARANRARGEQQLFQQLRESAAGRDDARRRLEIATLTVKQAGENLELVQGRYSAGKASSVELTDAQVALANARGDGIQARFDHQIAVAELRRAAGIAR